MIHTLTEGNGLPMANITTSAKGNEREQLRKRGIRAQFPKRQYKGRPIKIDVPHFQQKRCFAWYQRKYRRLAVRWERKAKNFEGFLSLAMIHLWITKILLVG